MSAHASQTKDRLLAAAIRRRELLSLRECFDPIDSNSRPTAAQQELFEDFGKVPTQWVVAANQSGKSQSGGRLVSWFVTETHPYWTRPKEWGEEPLLVLIAGRTGKQLEESIWPKIRSYLEPGTFKEVRVGNILQRVEMENGARILFQSLENPNVAAERIQSYVAHLVWIDEMPPTLKILAEAMVRRNSRSGYFLATFTPLVVNVDIQRMVDAAKEPHEKKYKFRMFDNPVYADPEKQAQVISSMATLPEHVRNTRLYGDWSQSDDQVYYFDWNTHVEMPEDYSPLWRHVEVVDPATQSALGLTVWAEHPTNHIWYCILAEYVKGIFIPTEIVKYVRSRTANMNVIRRISDPEATWYMNQAAAMGISYIGVYKKNNRKQELIKGLQEALGTRIRIAPHLRDLIDEFQECRWSDKADGKIVNGSRFHLLDTAQYFCDNIPKAEKGIVFYSQQEYLYRENEKRKLANEKARVQVIKQGLRRGNRRWM